MGILNYYKWIKDRYPTSISNNISYEKFDCILIDMNHIFYYCISYSKDYSDFENKLINKIDYILTVFNSNNYVFVIDGIASYAKLLLQIKRRKSYVENTFMSDLGPKTKLMIKIENCIRNKLESVKSNSKYIDFKFTLLFSDIIGEGEIKINKFLCENQHKNSLIITNDADVILIGIARKTLNNNIIIYNNNKEINLININNIMPEMKINFILYSILLGNDYLPKLLGYNYKMLELLLNSKIINIINNIIDVNHIIEFKYLNNQDKYNLYLLFNIINKNEKRVKIQKYDEIKIKKYLEGIFWNIYLYTKGEYSSYEYIYEYTNSPTSSNIIEYILNNINNKLIIPNNNNNYKEYNVKEFINMTDSQVIKFLSSNTIDVQN